jgi:diacylglycerol kinase (ATP)
MKHLFIVNPTAGKGKALKRISEIKDVMKKNEEDYIIEVTERPGHAVEIANKYSKSGVFRVYSVGGDGTLNEVLNGMAESGCSLGVIPAGSGNDFIRSIYCFENEKDIVKKVINGNEEYVDLGKVNGRYFLNISSAGIDAEVTYNARELKRLPLISGHMAYLFSIFTTVFKYKSRYMELKIDNKHIRDNTLLFAVANGIYYGGGMKIAPDARLNDGIFEICHVQNVSKGKILRLFPKLIKGEHNTIKEVSFHKGKNITLNCDEEFTLNIDGELLRTQEASFGIIPKGIKIIVP